MVSSRFEDAARRFPVAVVPALDQQGAALASSTMTPATLTECGRSMWSRSSVLSGG